jgi:hypothetical protein
LPAVLDEACTMAMTSRGHPARHCAGVTYVVITGQV